MCETRVIRGLDTCAFCRRALSGRRYYHGGRVYHPTCYRYLVGRTAGRSWERSPKP